MTFSSNVIFAWSGAGVLPPIRPDARAILSFAEKVCYDS